MARRTLHIALLAVSVFTAASAITGAGMAQGVNTQGIEAVTLEMRRDPAVMRNYSACPANVFGRVRGGAPVEGLTEAVCTAEPMRCWTLCNEGRNGTACFRLARVFQERGPENDPRSQILFTMACARGMAAGCTNRGAGVRNGEYDEDPFRKLSKARREACTFRSFDIACRQEDSWGCFMHGQAAASGEGVKRDIGRARDSFARACAATGGRGVAGCASANEALEDLKRRR
jgi:hypothetical protein